MKQIAYFVAALVALLATSCKTTEKNYREAYDKVMEKIEAVRAASADIDSLVTGDFFTSGRPVKYDINGDTLITRVEYVNLTKKHVGDNRTEPLERFNVVVAQFRQAFNARSLMERLRQMGYEAFVVNNNEPTYYVVASCCSMAVEALEQLNAVKRDTRLDFKPPFPYVLTPAQLMR